MCVCKGEGKRVGVTQSVCYRVCMGTCKCRGQREKAYVWTEFTGLEQSTAPDTGRSATALEGGNEEREEMSRRKRAERK